MAPFSHSSFSQIQFCYEEINIEDSIWAHYHSPDSFVEFLTTIALNGRQQAKLVAASFNSMTVLVNYYQASGIKAFKKYLQDVNKIFATASITALCVYYNPIIVNRLVGCVNYFNHTVHTFHTVTDIQLITIPIATALSAQRIHEKNKLNATKDENDDDIEILKLKGSINWTSFRDLFRIRSFIKLHILQVPGAFLSSILLMIP